MANTSRRKLRGDKMFLPMNIQGGSTLGKEYFISAPKLLLITAMIFVAWYLVTVLNRVGIKPIAWVVFSVILSLIYLKLIRKFVLEEDYFYSIYDRITKLDNVTPDLFWKVSSIKKTSDGDILIYDDMKIACIIKLERDTIVGKAAESSEIHYDAWSDFYKELHLKNLRFLQMNLMEPSGKDPRLSVLSNTASRAKNDNVRDALEMEMGYLKAISSATLSEFDYILIYTSSISRIDSLIDDVSECSYKLLSGAYSSAKILTEKEIYDLIKPIHNVDFFDGVQAQMNVYRDVDTKVPNLLTINKLRYSNGEVKELTDGDRRSLIQLSSLVSNGALRYDEWSVKDALDGNIEKLNNFNKKSIVKSDATVDKEKGNTKRSGKGEKIEKTGKTNKKDKPRRKLFNRNHVDLSMDETEDDIDDEDLLN